MPGHTEAAPYEDEPDDIPDSAVLFRRVAPPLVDWDQPDEEGRPRLHSGAFQDYTDERARELGYPGPSMSVHLASVLAEFGRAPQDLLAEYGPAYGLVRFTAGDLRAHSMGV